MNDRLIRATRTLLAVSVLAAFTTPAMAGGPLDTCASGLPLIWPAGGANIPFNPDQGPLGPLNHADAVASVSAAFAVWTAVPTSTASYTGGAELPVDVDITNFLPFLFPAAPDGLSAIVFDDTGEIFDLLFGPGSGVLGFASPEWFVPATCEVLEGVSFLNGPSFVDPTAAKDVMVHEFGHYSGLAHTVVNGQIYLVGDESGPTPFDTFAPAPAFNTDVIETMYPFYFGPPSGTQTLHPDDTAIISTLYPEPGFAGGSGSIAGTIFRSNGTSRLTGANVIARNVVNPFRDAVSAISGDFAFALDPSDPLHGTYRINGLTPGASYALYIDEILAGGFSTAPASFNGREEFYNGAGESNGLSTPDDPSVFTPIASVAGSPTTGVNVILNAFRPGDPLPIGDDDSLDLPLPFRFKVCGQEFDSLFVNSNGSVSFGAGVTAFVENVRTFLSGPPRIAGLWRDLNPEDGGTISFDQTANSFTVRWEEVPEFSIGGANTFSITLKRSSNSATIEYGALTAVAGLAGLSCGGLVTSGFENEQDLIGRHRHNTINMNDETAAFEIFTAGDNDLAGGQVTFVNFKRGFEDEFEPNDDLRHARRIELPFSTVSVRHFSAVSPVGGDVDYYRFRAKAGDILAIEVVRGIFDSTLGLFDADTGDLLLADDDGGGGLLSRLLVQVNVDSNLAIAVSAFPDLDFNGDGEEAGRYVLTVNRYRGQILEAGDDTSTELPVGFNFRFQGQSWSSVFVNSNGNLTFGAGDADFTETLAELQAGAPRIAPLWDDLDASFGLVIAETGSFSSTIHYVSVPEFFSDQPNYFTVRLLPLGTFTMEYGATARSDSLVGITEGGLPAGTPDPGETDLSGRLILRNDGTRYERFVLPEPFDLSFRSLLFVPFLGH